MTARLRPELADLPAYTPGKTVPGAIKIASNETVHGPLPSVRAAIDKATDTINRYPDKGYVALKDHLAACKTELVWNLLPGKEHSGEWRALDAALNGLLREFPR